MAVPGDIVSALLAAGEIADPYFDRNEQSLQWIGREDWLLERDIEIDAETLARERIFLEIEVLDTIAVISINSELLGTGANMFRPLRLDAKPLLRPGRNRFSVLISSPERSAAEAARALPYPVPHSEFPVNSPHRNLIRKAQCMAGWDWGPCLMTGGIYDGVSLLAVDGARIQYLTTKATRAGEAWRLAVTAWLDSPSARAVVLEAKVAGALTSRRFELAAGVLDGHGRAGAPRRRALVARRLRRAAPLRPRRSRLRRR